MLRPEIGPLGKSLTCRGVFLSEFGWRGAVWGGFQPVAGITAGITEQSSSDRRNTNLAWGFTLCPIPSGTRRVLCLLMGPRAGRQDHDDVVECRDAPPRASAKK